MSAQATSNRSTTSTRRSMSADQAMTRAQERMNSKINAAIAAGNVAQLQNKSMKVTLRLPTNSSVKLVDADGTVSDAGRHYYQKLGIAAPTIFAYEQPLENGKWVRAFDGKKKEVQRMTSDGWKPTKIGIEYFKYNRHAFRIEYPVRMARPIGNKRKAGERDRWQFVQDDEGDEYQQSGDNDITVGQLKINMMTATDTEKENHAREAAQRYISTRPTITVRDPSTGEEASYHIVVYDSPFWYVWDPTRPIRITLVRKHVYDRSTPTADEILQRPLQNFFVVPDDCYRPWDLHPESLVKNGKCAVTMIHECYTKRSKKGSRTIDEDDGRVKVKWGYCYTLTEQEIEAELDTIFAELGYTPGEYPYEKGWREDGVTSKMVLAFAKKHRISCRIYHKTVKHGNELDCWIPEGCNSNTPNMNFFVADDHCFWYGKPLHEKGQTKVSEANKGIANMWPKASSPRDDEDDKDEEEGFDMQEYIQLFCDKETMPFFKKADRTPPFSEWKSANDLLAAAPEFTDYHRPPDKLKSNGKRVQLHFYFGNLQVLEKALRKKLHECKNATVECKYGPSPDKPTILLVIAQHCPTFVIHEVPPDHQLLQSIFDKATEMLQLKKDKQLVYKGESMSQVCERLRLEIMRPSRHQWTQKERDTILSRQGHKCECGVELTKENTEIDHVVRLCDGGEDTVDNAVAKCITCHAEKSEIERLGAIYRKPLESHLSRNALEAFFDAPKPQQLMFGDGAPDCLKVDAIRCRSNALIHNEWSLPVASIIDEPVRYDPSGAKDPYHLYDCADFYYIDAGEPLDDPCDALPYAGPNWYWYENASAILGFGRSKDGRIDQSHILYSFKASNHEQPNVLAEAYAKIEAIVAAAMTGQTNPKTSLCPQGLRPYTEDEIRKQAKFMILAMQGSWTSQHHHSWQVVNSLYEESCPGPVHMYRPNTDGTRRLMTRTDMLTNRTMFLIGRIALDKEHLHLWQLIFRLKQIPRAPTLHGCINDCLYLRPVKENEEKLADKITNLIAEHVWLRFKNGDPKFKLERTKEVVHFDETGRASIRIDDEEHLFLCDAPENKHTWKYAAPKPSRWTHLGGGDWGAEILQEKDQLKEDGWSYGHWSVNGAFLVDPPWNDIAEEKGIGRGPDDTFQEEMAEKLAQTGGGMVIGRGGTGKSHLIKLLVPKLEKIGYTVICIAFTHVAVANLNGVECDAHTILHLLYKFVGSKKCKKKNAVIIDECSMVPMSMWSALLNMRFLGHEIYVMGDYEGQFTPIEDSHRQHQWEQLWNSRFMLDMCNGLRIKLNKFRRQAADGRPLDFDHFQFVGSIYPGKMCLADALMQARDRYPVAGCMCLGTTLCISHRCRVAINRAVNIVMARINYVEVPANPDNSNEANQPQNMRIYTGIVLIARCKTKEKHLKNGVRYKVRAITDGDDDQHNFEMIAVTDDNQETGESFIMTTAELGNKMRLSYAITYFSSQARTINGPLRLAQTSSKNFTLRHLIVGLGRGPASRDIEVE